MMSNIRTRKQQILFSSKFEADKIGVFWLKVSLVRKTDKRMGEKSIGLNS